MTHSAVVDRLSRGFTNRQLLTVRRSVRVVVRVASVLAVVGGSTAPRLAALASPSSGRLGQLTVDLQPIRARPGCCADKPVLAKHHLHQSGTTRTIDPGTWSASHFLYGPQQLATFPQELINPAPELLVLSTMTRHEFSPRRIDTT